VGILSLLGVAGISLGCGKSPSAPTPLPAMSVTPVSPNAEFTVTAIAPPAGLPGDSVKVAGAGFLPGATLKLDGIAARITSVTSTVITAITPVHAAGTADVIVINPGGQSGALTGGFTYEVVTLTVSSNQVAPGSQLSVSWEAPGGRSTGDWIALLKVGSPSTSYSQGWWEYTNGARSGTLTLSAPVQPGEYEFRYLADDGFVDAARSGRLTVVGS
jgi:IPT/TIG domain-containing protein